jgi:hypothetical protein
MQYIMSSKLGFICETLEDDSGPYLKALVMMDVEWKTDGPHRKFYENFKHGIEFHNLKSLWGRALTERKVVISNNVALDSRSSGYPSWHPKLEYAMIFNY